MKKNKRFLKWRNRHRAFTAVGVSYLLTPHKALQAEAVCTKRIQSFVRAFIDWTHERDHAGLVCEVGLLWFNFSFKIQDTRRWNSEHNDWDEGAPWRPFKYDWF